METSAAEAAALADTQKATLASELATSEKNAAKYETLAAEAEARIAAMESDAEIFALESKSSAQAADTRFSAALAAKQEEVVELEEQARGARAAADLAGERGVLLQGQLEMLEAELEGVRGEFRVEREARQEEAEAWKRELGGVEKEAVEARGRVKGLEEEVGVLEGRRKGLEEEVERARDALRDAVKASEDERERLRWVGGVGLE